MTVEVRPAGDSESGWSRLVAVDAVAFGGDADLDNEDRAVMELDRAVLAWEGDQAVGCAASFPLELSVPGGTVPSAGLTWVGVIPTHRRRGVMTQLLADRHRSALAAGEPVAVLWASQSAIYPRFGYGVASRSLSLSIPSTVDLLRAPSADGVQVTLLPSADDAEPTREVYRTARRTRPGMPALDDRWSERAVRDRPDDRDGGSPLRTFVASRDGRAIGYARFRQHHDWSTGVGTGSVRVRELLSVEPAAAAAVWGHLHRLESMATTRAWNVALDDPVLHWVSEIRSVELRMREQLYLRVLDLPAALTARCYRTDLDVVLEVTDGLHPDNAGRWRLSGGPTGATCARTADPADLSMDIRALGAALLGSTSLDRMAAAGEVGEHRPGTLDRAGIAFGHPVEAWCPMVF